MIKNYNVPPVFVTNTPLSPTDINTLLYNALALYSIAYLRGSEAYQSNATNGGNPSVYTNWGAHNPQTLWRGAFQYRTGQTTATFTLNITKVSSETVQIFFNGVSVYNASISNGSQTINISITGLGYVDKTIVEVLVNINRSNPALKNGQYLLEQAYVSPIVDPFTWPGLPTFGPISAANLNLLSSASDWLANRLSLVPYTLFQALMWVQTNHNVATTYLWSGALDTSNGNTQFHMNYGMIPYNTAEQIVVTANGTTIYTSPTYACTDYKATVVSDPVYVSVDISSYTSPVDILVQSVITTAQPNDGRPMHFNSKFRLRNIYVAQPNRPNPAAIAVSQFKESLSFATLQTRLQALTTLFQSVYTLIQNAPAVFARQHMFRRRFSEQDTSGTFDHQENDLQTLMVARMGARQGDYLTVRGKAIKLAYGHPTFTQATDIKVTNYTYAFTYETEVIHGESVQNVVVPLDQFKGLDIGDEYYLLGMDLRYAAESLRNV
jgi:hypothetical protein